MNDGDQTSGGGGGSGKVTGTNTTLTAATGQNAANNSDTDYANNAGLGGNSAANGNPGRIVITPSDSSTSVNLIGSWGTGTSHTAPTGSNRTLIFVAGMQKWGDTPTLTSVTYGGQSLTKVNDVRIHTDNGGRVEIWMLDETGIAAASGSTFVPTWDLSPDDTAYSHAFFSNVHQTNAIYIYATNSTVTTTPNPITAAALDTNNGDMVVVAAGGFWQSGTYAPQNGFTEGNDQQSGSVTLGTAYKAATGSSETPSMTHSDASGSPYGQVIAGMVLRHVDSSAYRDGRLLGWWSLGLTHPAESGTNRALLFVGACEKWSSTRTLSSVTYGGQSMTYVDSVSKNFQDGNTGTLEFWILDESGIAAASSSTFVPTWSGTCDNGPIYSSAFFAEIDQTTPTGAKATNSTDLATPNPITTTGLSTTSGDVVVTAALGYSGTDAYSPQNSFTEGNDHNADDKITLGTAYKAATGATETPSMTNSDYTSDLTGQSIIGVVLNYDNGATPDLEQIHYRWRNDNGGESSSQTTIYLTSGTSWVVPANWNNANNSIEVIGGGGGGESRAAGGDGGGGGGGAYSKETNVSLTASSTVTINIGSGGAAGEPASAGGDTYLCNSTSNCASIAGTAVQVGAKGGAGGSASGAVRQAPAVRAVPVAPVWARQSTAGGLVQGIRVLTWPVVVVGRLDRTEPVPPQPTTTVEPAATVAVAPAAQVATRWWWRQWEFRRERRCRW
jgi:hypothetical protein